MNDGSNRLEGGFGRSSNLHVEGAARIVVAFKNRKVRLFRILAETTITEVRHHADDFDVRLDVGPRALTDARAERVPPRQVSLDKGFVDDCRALARFAHRPGIAFVKVSPGSQPDTQGSKESGADSIVVDRAIGGDSLIRLNRHGVHRASTGQQLHPRDGRHFGAWRTTEFVVNAPSQLARFFPGVAVSTRIEAE